MTRIRSIDAARRRAAHADWVREIVSEFFDFSIILEILRGDGLNAFTQPTQSEPLKRNVKRRLQGKRWNVEWGDLVQNRFRV